MKILVVIQARTGSTRLPGKVLLPLAGAPLLVRMVERVRAAHTPFEIVVATTTDPVDDMIVRLCERHSIPVFRGHPTDLLDRHYQAAAAHRAELVVKIPSDCPLIDPRVIDRVLGAYEPGLDFVSNLYPATYPDGNDVEVMTFNALSIAAKEANKPHEREHTTPFLWDQPARFRLANVVWETGEDESMTRRLTVDYAEDYAMLAAVFDALYKPARPIFSLDDILRYLDAHPEVDALNKKFCGVNWYRHHLDQLRTVTTDQTRILETNQ